MSQDNLEKKTLASLTDEINTLGYNIVTFRIVSHNNTPNVSIAIEKSVNLEPISVNDCRAVSKLIRNNTAVAELLGEFGLEVSSIGAERPLLSLQDYQKFIGREAKVELSSDLDGQKRYKGVITDTKDDMILLSVVVSEQKKIVSIPITNVKRANLIFTDEMFKNLMNKSK